MVLIAANQDTVFGRLAQAMGQPELAKDPRDATHAARGEHQEQLDALIGNWAGAHTRAEVLGVLERAGVPSGLIYRAPEMLADAHFAARRAIVSVPHPDFGELKMQNVAPKLSETPGSIRSPSPRMGEHNERVYREILGLSAEQMEDLRARKVI
jgi:formyl-CoA transferase